MALIFFTFIAILVGGGFLWIIQEMVFKVKWPLFIFFLTAFLPFYITSLSVVYLATQSSELVGAFQILKEVVVMIAVLVWIFFNKRIFDYPFRLQSTDWTFLGFLTLGFIYLILPIGESSFLNRTLYFKAMLIPGLVYFLGRNSKLEDVYIQKLFLLIFGIGIAAFLVNCIEKFILDAHLQQFTGYALYNQAINAIEPSGNFGLTWTFETQAVTKRLASFFSDPLEMASSVLMGFAAGLIWFLTSKKEYTWLPLVVMACSMGSLIFSASRAAFGAFFIMIFFVALVFKLYRLIATGLVALVCFAIYVVFFASDDFYFFVIDTLTFENTSSIGHVIEWLLSLDSMIANPLGIGLAMSGNAGSVAEDVRVGGENQFLIYGVQMGWIGMMLYLLTLLTGIILSLKVFYRTENAMTARIAFVGAVTKVGMLLPLFTANAEMYTYVSWVTWWMLGYSIKEFSLIKFREPNSLKSD